MVGTAILASVLVALLTPLAAWGSTLGFARLGGRLMRWRDMETGRPLGFDIRGASSAVEFTGGFVRALVTSALAVGIFQLLGAKPALLAIAIVMALLSGWNVWVLTTHRRMWPIAVAAGARSQSLDDQAAELMKTEASRASGILETAVRSRWLGDLAGAALLGLLLWS